MDIRSNKKREKRRSNPSQFTKPRKSNVSSLRKYSGVHEYDVRGMITLIRIDVPTQFPKLHFLGLKFFGLEPRSHSVGRSQQVTYCSTLSTRSNVILRADGARGPTRTRRIAERERERERERAGDGGVTNRRHNSDEIDSRQRNWTETLDISHLIREDMTQSTFFAARSRSIFRATFKKIRSTFPVSSLWTHCAMRVRSFFPAFNIVESKNTDQILIIS